MTRRTVMLVCAAGLATGSCSTLPKQAEPATRLAVASHAAPVFSDAVTCRDEVARVPVAAGDGLDANRLGLLSWNVKKGRHDRWHHDLARMARDKDLVLIQEASLDAGLMGQLQPTAHWAFAPGYRTKRGRTGVLTLSTQPPITQCNLQAFEPILGTPKATSITRFELKDTPETLLVANIHAVNFTFGLAEFRRQMSDLRTVLAAHSGPIILSGDFNTWRLARIDIVDAMFRELGLERVEFREDHRTRFFGLPLDHLFVRGLALEHAATQPVRTSDHNPLSAALRFEPTTPAYLAGDVQAQDDNRLEEVAL